MHQPRVGMLVRKDWKYGSLSWLVVAILMSGIYIAAEETLEKAAAAEDLPRVVPRRWPHRELRSLGFGILARVNAVGDMVSSLYVGFLLQAEHGSLAFSLAAGFGLLGVVWLAVWLAMVDKRSRGT